MIRMLIVNGRTRPVDCAWRYCKHRRMMLLIRNDTNAIVDTRAAHDWERQPDMFAVYELVDSSGGVSGPVLSIDGRIEKANRRRASMREPLDTDV